MDVRQSTLGGSAQTEAREMTFTEKVADSLSDLIGALNDTCNRLQLTRDRTFGGMPEPANATSAVAPVPNGGANAIFDQLARATKLAYGAQSLASELQSRL